MRKLKAFTLVEILIVVVLLGALAAIVIPTVANSATAAKEAALVQDLKMLRRYILVYKGQHMEVPPGYPNGQATQSPTEQAFVDQMTTSSTLGGQTAPVGTPGFDYGPYLTRIPVNPFNGKNGVQMLSNDEDFPPAADDSHGWIYKPATSQIRPDNTGTDSTGKRYYDY